MPINNNITQANNSWEKLFGISSVAISLSKYCLFLIELLIKASSWTAVKVFLFPQFFSADLHFR